MKLPSLTLWLKLAAVLGLLAAVAAGYLWSRDEGPIPAGFKRGVDQPMLQSHQIVLYELQQGRRVWIIEARAGSYHEGQRTVALEDITLRFYQNNAVVVTIRAQSAQLHTDSRNILLPDGAEGRAPERALSFSAGKVQWFGTSQVLLGSGDVVFRQGPHVVTADHFRADVALQRVRLTGRVRARLRPFLLQMRKHSPGFGLRS